MFEIIRANHRRSIFLIVGMAVVLLVLGAAIGGLAGGPDGMIFGIGFALILWGVQLMLAHGAASSILLAGSGARQIQRADSPQLVNIVEEMQLAAGLPALPRIYLIDDPAPNAFAMGTRPDNWAVAVTTGLLHRLNRDELQGVIAHEIGHLKNRDVQFMTQAAVMLGSIIILSEIVWRSMRFGGRSRRRDDSRGGGGQAQLIFFLVAILFAILGPIVAQLLYFACSRKREYLADASGALYTRYPEGLAGALEKIAGSRAVPAFAGKAIAPLFIVNPLAAAGQSASLFSTHPPTAERVRILRGMTGASFAAYEEAYRTATGKGILGTETLRADQPATIRDAGPTGPLAPHREVRDLNFRTQGYRAIHCSCGMAINIPPGYEAQTIRCVRCRSPLPLPG